MLSDPPSVGAMASSLPVVPGRPVVLVVSELLVRPARTITSPGANQNLVVMVSVVSSVSLVTQLSAEANRVFSSSTRHVM